MTVYFHPLTVPLSCGSGESSTGAVWVRYCEEPWDFLCFWAFLMDFLVNPSTFSDAEMADILMHKLTKTSDKLLYSPRWNERFPLLFLPFASAQKYVSQLRDLKLVPCSSLMLFCMIQHGRSALGLDCVQRLHRWGNLLSETREQSSKQEPQSQTTTHDYTRSTTRR